MSNAEQVLEARPIDTLPDVDVIELSDCDETVVGYVGVAPAIVHMAGERLFWRLYVRDWPGSRELFALTAGIPPEELIESPGAWRAIEIQEHPALVEAYNRRPGRPGGEPDMVLEAITH